MNFTFKNIFYYLFPSIKLLGFVKKVLFIIILLSTNIAYTQSVKLVVNEFSQGTTGNPMPSTNNKEYIELVVVGTRTCMDSTVDIRGWIIDDNNGWYGTGPISGGHIRFANNTNWAKVEFGSVILIYNDADKNGKITQSDDPTDNLPKDHVYILPISSSYLESSNNPASGSAVTTYAGSTYTSTPSWTSILLNNAGDAILIVDPSFPTSAHFSITYGNITGGSPTIYKTSVIGGKNCYLSNANYATASSWLVGTAPADETPGLGNITANIAWLDFMQKTAYPAAPTALSPQNFCSKDNPTVANLTPTASSTIKWYSVAGNGMALAASTPLLAGTNTYYVSQTNSNGCESARTAVTVTVNTSPAPPIITHN